MNIQRPVKSPVKGSDRVRAFRARQKAKGLKPVTFWVPDLNDPAVQARIRAECKAIAVSEQEKTDMEFVESLSAWLWEAGSPWVYEEKD